MNITQLRNTLEQRKGQRNELQRQLTDTTNKISGLKKDLRFSQQALAIIQKVGQETQQQIEFYISDIVSLALAAVFDNPYKLKLNFVVRRNRTECDILFERDGEVFLPMNDSGGIISVAAFALRPALWCITSPKTQNTLILDEPFLRLKGEEANRRALIMINEMSKKIGIQIIMVSDERVSKEEIIELSDKVFSTEIINGITEVTNERQ